MKCNIKIWTWTVIEGLEKRGKNSWYIKEVKLIRIWSLTKGRKEGKQEKSQWALRLWAEMTKESSKRNGNIGLWSMQLKIWVESLEKVSQIRRKDKKRLYRGSYWNHEIRKRKGKNRRISKIKPCRRSLFKSRGRKQFWRSQ